jgi:hypothetical protein
MILFLDDDENRTQRLVRKIPWAKTYTTAGQVIDKLAEVFDHDSTVEILFLDHDLGGEQFVDSGREDCGMEVVRWLEQNDLWGDIKKIIVHSHNTPAAIIMESRLKNAGYNVERIPFMNLIDRIS